MPNNVIDTSIGGNDLIFLWRGADSKVFRISGTNKVLKIYPELSLEEIQNYHRLHNRASRLTPSAGIRLPGNFSWAWCSIRYVQIRVLDLLNCPIIAVWYEDFRWVNIRNQKWNSLTLDPIPDKGLVTVIPYVWWEELYPYSSTPQWKYLLDICSEELEANGVPVVGTSEFERLHPINIKVFPPFGDIISLVITDIGASIKGTLALNKVLTQSPPSV